MAQLVFPPRCVVCDAEFALDSVTIPVCDPCRQALVGGSAHRCPRCGMPVARSDGTNSSTSTLVLDPSPTCETCHGRRLHFDAVWALGDYQAELRAVVLRMKHAQEEPLAAAVAELVWLRTGQQLAAWRPDVLLPVPMHWARRLVRGTNNPDTLARMLACQLHVADAAGALVRHRSTRPQGGLTRPSRFANLRGAFRLRPGIRFDKARVVLVDDILTTGATCNEAAKLLKQAGAAAVGVVVAARAQGPGAGLGSA